VLSAKERDDDLIFMQGLRQIEAKQSQHGLSHREQFAKNFSTLCFMTWQSGCLKRNQALLVRDFAIITNRFRTRGKSSS